VDQIKSVCSTSYSVDVPRQILLKSVDVCQNYSKKKTCSKFILRQCIYNIHIAHQTALRASMEDKRLWMSYDATNPPI